MAALLAFACLATIAMSTTAARGDNGMIDQKYTARLVIREINPSTMTATVDVRLQWAPRNYGTRLLVPVPAKCKNVSIVSGGGPNGADVFSSGKADVTLILIESGDQPITVDVSSCTINLLGVAEPDSRLMLAWNVSGAARSLSVLRKDGVGTLDELRIEGIDIVRSMPSSSREPDGALTISTGLNSDEPVRLFIADSVGRWGAAYILFLILAYLGAALLAFATARAMVPRKAFAVLASIVCLGSTVLAAYFFTVADYALIWAAIPCGGGGAGAAVAGWSGLYQNYRHSLDKVAPTEKTPTEADEAPEVRPRRAKSDSPSALSAENSDESAS